MVIEHMAEEVLPTQIRFSRELTPLRAVSLGLAILLAASVFTLQGPIMSAAGAGAAWSYLLMGGVFLLNLVCYVALQLGSDEEGGAYVLVRQIATVPLAFLTGWSILLGGLLLCAVLALGFAAQIAAAGEAFLALRLPKPPIAGLLIVGVVLYNILGGPSFRRRRHLVVWGVVVVLSLLSLLCLPHVRLENYRLLGSQGHFAIEAGLSLLLIGFLAFESVALAVSEIPQPKRTIPRAFFAIVFVGTTLSVLSSFVVAGCEPGLSWSEVMAPMAAMAERYVGVYGQLLLLLIGMLFVPVALNSTLLFVIRQAQVLDQDNLLPGVLRREGGRLGGAHLLFLFMGVLAAIPSLWGDLAFVARLGGFFGLFLASMTALAHILRLRSLRGSRGFRLGLRPLIPAVALAVNLFFLPTLGARSLLGGVILTAAGLVIYLTYARKRYVVGREGVVVFKGRRERAEAAYRVLVPLGPEGRQPGLIRLAAALAGDEGGEVLPLRVVPLPEQVPLSHGARMAREIESLFSWSLASEETGTVALTPMTRVARAVHRGIIDTAVEEECDVVLLSWEGYAEPKGRTTGHVVDAVIQNAPCDVVLLKGQGLTELETILVPTSGGPHAPLAAQIALKLARLYGARVTALYIVREGATAEERQHGLEMIARTVGDLDTDDLIKPKVIAAAGVVRGILAEAKKHDLLLLGASEESLFDRFLFGTVPERIARKSPVPVMIAKRHAPLPQFWLRRAWDAVYGFFPTLEAQERSTVYRQVREGARADIDFFVMISLAAIIATLGLLLSSPAVIIGGMLVAPLMSPIIGIALAISLGNIRLLRDAAESTIKGIFLAVVIAVFLASISPLAEVNDEILARTRPNLLDLVVALASGAAGAYAVSRKDVSAALPGVAIAAALVPPLGVIGIGLAMRRAEVAGGGLLLFSTNLVAITLAGAVNFLFLGFRPARGMRERMIQLRRAFVISALLLFAISLPLAFIFGTAVQATREREVISQVLNQELSSLESVSLVSFDFNHQQESIALTVTVYAAEDIDEGVVARLDDLMTQAVGQPVTLRLIAIPVSEMAAP